MSLKNEIELAFSEIEMATADHHWFADTKAILKALKLDIKMKIFEIDEHYRTYTSLKENFVVDKFQADVSEIRLAIDEIVNKYKNMELRQNEIISKELSKVRKKSLINKNRTEQFYGWSPQYLAFKCFREFYYPKIYDIRNWLYPSEYEDSTQLLPYEVDEILQEIGNGIADAKILFDLERMFTDVTNSSLIQNPNSSKIVWSGSPGEFGAIFFELIDRKYIYMQETLKAAVRDLQKHFIVKSSTGSEVIGDHLYKCFGEKSCKYNPGELNIPRKKGTNAKS